MPNMSQMTIGNVTYDLKDTEGRAHVVEVSNTKPVHEDNKIWIKDQENEYVVPSYDEFEDLKQTITSEVKQYEDYGNGLLSRGNFRQGVYAPTTGRDTYGNDYMYRIAARIPIIFPRQVTLTIKSGFRILPYRYENNAWAQKSWATGSYDLPANEPLYCQIARTTESTSEIADVAEFLQAVTVNGTALEQLSSDLETTNLNVSKNASDIATNAAIVAETDFNLSEALEVGYFKPEFEQGQWSYSIPDTTKTIRLKSTKLYPVKAGTRVIFFSRSLRAYCAVVATRTGAQAWLENSGWLNPKSTMIESVYTIQNDGYLVINLRNEAGTAISVSDIDGYLYIIPNGNVYNIPEKAAHVYHFGGTGNDWCFVRTPANYDPKRQKPYPFVICNHGNGWTMDGTLLTSNWTNITMYWSESKTGWVAGRMIDTDDETMWGSNPTIEALLAAGYVVCGCENYADAQYGNTPCRNACVDFFYHMISHYNVEKRCYMIGASNGAMTSLNAAYILQGAVKAMVLQYPLTCLANQYFSNTGHQAGIKSAYGIPTADVGSEDTTENRAKLTKYVATHDPLTVDVVDGKKIGSFPPVKLYYSPDDIVTRASVNALVLYDLLEASNKVVDKVQCSGAHGDQSHFAPADYVAWFNAH